MNDQDDRDGELDPDTAYSPSSEQETEALQHSPRKSQATEDPEIDGEDIRVLPGTGGPDDQGDVEIDDDDYDLPTG